VSIRESIEAVLTILGHRMKDRIEVITQFADLDVISCYPAALNQAIMNLVSNSIDAMPDRGTLWIETVVEEDEYRIVVADSGEGIPEEIRDRVLDPFFTTKPVGEGTGLGLSITYTIVKKHGGTLDLSQRPGGGTQAIVRLPLRPFDAA
jgi:two-component system NtrC family sensor kinase